MAIRVRNAVVASSSIAALLVACLLSANGGNLAKAQPDWASRLVRSSASKETLAPAQPDWGAQTTSQGPGSASKETLAPAEPDWDAQTTSQGPGSASKETTAPQTTSQMVRGSKRTPSARPNWGAQMASIIQQVANQTFLSSFGQIFTSYFESGQLFIDQDATILIPTNVGYWRYETQWDTLTRKQKRRLLRYHILKGRYTTQQLLDAAPLTLFPTFNQNLPVNKTLKPNEVYFQSVPPTRFVSPLSVPNAGLTDNIAAHGVTMVLQPPNLN
ncbi:unnamed protein product [Closterium sp. Yama58-4]|nr:unnamed protein product [Closterium sp. Yama58-4]